MGLPVVTGPPDGVGLHRVVGLPGAVGCQLSLDILFIVIRLLSLTPAPSLTACLSLVNRWEIADSRSVWPWHWPC